MTQPLVGVLAALVAGLLGLLVPTLVARLPEPEEPEASEQDVPEPVPAPAAEPAKEPYAAIAALRWLRPLAAVGGASLAAALAWRLWPEATGRQALLMWVPLVPLGVALAVIDARTRLLPKRLVLPATAAVVALGCLVALADGSTGTLVRALVGLAAAYVLFFALWYFWPAGMGYGDVRLAALLGFVLGWLGWAELVVGLYAGFLVMGLYGLGKALVRRDRRELRRAVPFGPFLLAGTWLAPFVAGPVAVALGR